MFLNYKIINMKELNLISKERFIEQNQKNVQEQIYHQLEHDLKAQNKKLKKRLVVNRILFWTSFVIFFVSIIFFILGIFEVAFKNKILLWKSHLAVAIVVFIFLSIFSLLTLIVTKYFLNKIRNTLFKKFSLKPLFHSLFSYFGFKYHNNEIEEKQNISFFKNINNFKEMNNSYHLTHHYKQHAIITNNTYVRMQNLHYKSENYQNFYDLKFWTKIKYILKIWFKKGVKWSSYQGEIEEEKNIQRFGLSFKLTSLNKNLEFTLFDKNNYFTPGDYTSLVLDDRYEFLKIKNKKNEALTKWVNESTNLEAVKVITQMINNYKFINFKYKFKKSTISNLSLKVSNQEIFIWFNTKEQILNFTVSPKIINTKKWSQLMSKKILNDFYFIYLICNLVVPFGLEIKNNKK
ncbi:hypothetical protein MCSF7_00844 [Mycoplasmopsis columbina SF7]|uniref:DUF3137 domain-containing protein n=2 Tax=Mycoplasmopsis columbina TaxID=114881 RepID=F9UJW2_9BACT|nr:hypothetical protein MCSF7_00844 [Mycoplasmopsis columbina SF7]